MLKTIKKLLSNFNSSSSWRSVLGFICLFASTAWSAGEISVLNSSTLLNPLSAGQTQTIKVNLQSTVALKGVIAAIRIVDSQSKMVSQKVLENLVFSAYVSREFQSDYTAAASLPLGRYSVQVGVWNSAWATYLYETLSYFDVSTAGAVAPTPTPTPTPTPAPAPTPAPTPTTGKLAPILSNPANMLANPGFELPVNPGYASYGWNNWGGATSVATQQRSGSRALQLAPNGGISLNDLVYMLAPGKNYRFSAYAKLGAAGEDVTMVVELKNAAGTVIFKKSVNITSTTYQLYQIDFPMTADVTDPAIYFYKNGGSANAYFDDVVLSTAATETGRYAYPSDTPTNGISYPFGSHLVAYVAGIRPSNVTQASQDAVIKSFYDKWKGGLRTNCGDYHLDFGSAKWGTVSEGIGYGMLMTVLMAGHDPQAKTIFDGLLNFARNHPAHTTSTYLMDWAIKTDCTSGGNGEAALDGDLDIAMGLLMADRQWGSAGANNYMDEAVKRITAIRYAGFKPDGMYVWGRLGMSRTSDFMISHFRAFKKATNDAFWDLAINKSFELMEQMQAKFSPNVGLIPDFIVGLPDNGVPSPGGLIESMTEGDYAWNANRIPWRLGTDYVTSGDARLKGILQKLVGFFQSSTGGIGGNVAAGYTLDGKAYGYLGSQSFNGPMAAGAMIDPSFQNFLNSLWTWNVANPADGYYDNELQLIPMIVTSGNWWQP